MNLEYKKKRLLKFFKVQIVCWSVKVISISQKVKQFVEMFQKVAKEGLMGVLRFLQKLAFVNVVSSQKLKHVQVNLLYLNRKPPNGEKKEWTNVTILSFCEINIIFFH